MNNKKLINAVLLASFSVLLTSCFGFLDPKEDTTQFYIMRAANVKKVDVKDKLSITLSPITTPSYMARNQIVTLAEDGSVKLAEFDRWAESVQSGFSRSLVEALAATSENVDVFAYPSFCDKGFNLRIYVYDCIGNLGGNLEFKGKWQADNANEKISLSKDFSMKIECGNTYSSYVGAVNKALENLAFDVIKTISEQKNKSKK